ncbi:MAG: hypothetical protein EI684_20255 [Candidatus Viridilinea halotolerans]|uniref:Lysidine-tRNA(Ile) synthetase C-terminal domain-containing protein n=1 Tax=Candidatus Viridilinea halotolerans TaxID=2491704 RepID=A0A426TS51_9CHLR|nr:MAG: hypothetical protein EI684_20255 [Candidatus Viridilinea halotolerans]
MQRHALRRAAAHLGAPELSFEQIAAARSLTAHPGRHMDLTAHVYLVVEQQTLVLVRGLVQPYADVPQLTSTDLSLVNPGITPIGNDWFCSITTVAPAQPDRWWLALDPRRLDGPLSLRCRQPGDRFYPLGGQGSRKLQDFFVDQKISRALRAAWPLLVTPNAIVWVVGIRPDRRFHGAPQDSIWVGMVQKRTSSCGGNLGEASPTQ